MKEIIQDYFTENPEAWDGVKKAHFAYHAKSPSLEFGAHDFESCMRSARCNACGRLREGVRFDNNLPECSKWSGPPDITGIIRQEEEKYFLLVNNSKSIIDKFIKKHGLSGKTLCILHHTHGIDVEIFETHHEISKIIREDYYKEWDIHKKTGGKYNGVI